jgi:stage II sporulation protein D
MRRWKRPWLATPFVPSPDARRGAARRVLFDGQWSRLTLGVSLVASALLAGGCATGAPPVRVPPIGPAGEAVPPAGALPPAAAGAVFTDTANARLAAGDRVAWVALAGGLTSAPVSGLAAFEVRERGGRQTLVRGRGGESWRIEQRGRTLRVAGMNGDATPWRPGPFVLRTTRNSAPLAFDGSRYRGELWISPTDSGLLVVNRLPVEDYLRGVVPLELGTRSGRDAAALQAQAIAARSYTYVRVPAREAIPRRGYHVTATVLNQVYGGVKVEHPVVDAAIAATTGLVLRYNGTVVDGPYSSSCGGRTAVPSEAWSGEPDHGYLQSVSDIDPADRSRLLRPVTAQQLDGHVQRAAAPSGRLSGTSAPAGPEAAQRQWCRTWRVRRRSGSGRVAVLDVETNRGAVSLDGRDIRAAFRNARGAILFSTYFDVVRTSRDGARVVLGGAARAWATDTASACASGGRSVALAPVRTCGRS